MLNLFIIPSASSTIEAITAYSSPWFTELLPIAYVAIGVSIGVGFVIFMTGLISGYFYGMFKKHDE